MCKPIGCLIILFFVMPVATPAAVINVPADYPTIHAAVAAASSGDEIIVAPGTYAYNVSNPIDFSGKEIYLHSSGGPEVTVIAKDYVGMAGHGIKIESGEGPGAILEGFTLNEWALAVSITGSTPIIRNNIFFGNYGPNIVITGSSPTIKNNIFKGWYWNDSGISMSDSDSEITFNSFRGMALGGVQVWGASKPKIHHNVFKDSSGFQIQLGDNWTTNPIDAEIHHNLFLRNHGTVIRTNDPSTASITDNHFFYNDCVYDNILTVNLTSTGLVKFERNYCKGFIAVQYQPCMVAGPRECLFLRNNVFATFFNTQASNCTMIITAYTKPWGGGGALLENCTFHDVQIVVNLTNSSPYNYDWALDSIIWNWLPPTYWLWLGKIDFHYSDVGPKSYGGSTCFNQDPLFVNAAEGDFHLLAGSPCIDKPGGGTSVTVDLDGNPRDAMPDIGAYEYVGASHWYTGASESGGTMRLVLQGQPGDPAMLAFSFGLLPVPLPTQYGPFHLMFPFQLLMLGPIGSKGVLEISFTLPVVDLPVVLYTQALIGSTLTAPREVMVGG